MTFGRKQLYIAAFLIAVFTLPAGTLSAHVEEGHMPDAVAEVEYKILLEFKPKDIDTRTKLAFVLIRQGKLGDAEKELGKAASFAHDDPRVLEGYVVLRLKQKRVDDALNVAKKAVHIAPDSAILYLHFGKALEAVGKKDEARSIYHTGLKKIADTKNDHDRVQLEEAIKNIEATLTQTAIKQ